MTKQTPLAEKRKTNVNWKPYKELGFYWEEDVKEAVARLKECFTNQYGMIESFDLDKDIKEKIDEIMGRFE